MREDKITELDPKYRSPSARVLYNFAKAQENQDPKLARTGFNLAEKHEQAYLGRQEKNAA